tara:strand:+ start:268 stop:396 length:129 start_codon:yes stop_codon:yes gene_type:complete
MITDGAKFAIISVFIVIGVIMLGIGTSLAVKEGDDNSKDNEN